MTDEIRPSPSWPAVAGATFTTELRRWSRQPVAVASALVLPLLMATLISLALGDDLSEYTTDVAFVDLDGGAAATAFEEQALGGPAVDEVVDVRRASSPDEARRMVDDGDVGAAIILPAGLTEALGQADGPERPPIDVVRSDDDPIAGDLSALIVNGFEVRARAVVLAEATGAPGSDDPWPLELSVAALGGPKMTAATHYGPSLGLFFVLLTMGFPAARLVADRQRGVIDRLATTPVPYAAVLIGRAASALAVGAVSLATVAVAMPLLFDAGWGPPGAVLAVSSAVVLALTGVAALIAGLARTPDQAQALAVSVSFALALASGSFSPPGSAARPFFAEIAPTTHALDAFATLTTGGGGIDAVMPSILLLLAFGALCLGLASRIGWRFP